jgi:hypothetical protein
VVVLRPKERASKMNALGLMYGEHIFYIEPSQIHHATSNEQQTLKTKNKMNTNINIVP